MSEIVRYLLLSGDDVIGRERARGAFIESLQTACPGLTEEHFDSSAEDFSQYASRMLTPSLFSEMRLFSIRHAQKLSPAELAQVKEVLQADPPDICLLVEYDDEGKKEKVNVATVLGYSALVKKTPAVFSVQKFASPRSYKLAEWLTETVPQLFGRTITKPSAEALLELTGTDDLSTVYAELTKIDIFLPRGAAIDKSAIESIIGASRRIEPHELAKAVGLRDAARTIDLVRALFADEAAVPLYVSTLFRHFWKLLLIRGAVEKAPELAKRYFAARDWSRSEAGHAIFVSAGLMDPGSEAKKAYPLILDQLIEQAKFYKTPHLKTIFGWLADYDAGVKTGRVAPSVESFELLCYRIMRVSQLAGVEVA